MELSAVTRFLRGAFLLVFTAAGAHATVPLEDFFQPGAFSAMKLSPTGRHVAMTISTRNGPTRLVVMDTATMKANVLRTVTDSDNNNARMIVGQFDWVNEERLVYSVRMPGMYTERNHPGTGLFGQNRDGTNFRQLIDQFPRRDDSPFAEKYKSMDLHARFFATSRKKDSNEVFVTRDELGAVGEIHNVQLLRLDTATGEHASIEGPGFARAWLIDQDDVPRIAVTADGRNGALRHFDPATKQWERLADFERTVEAGLDPVGFAPDGALYVAANRGKDKRALYRYDLAGKRFDAEPVVNLQDFDFEGELLWDAGHLLGVRYNADALATSWFEPRMKEIQARIDRLLPGTLNVLETPVRAEVPVVLVLAYSDVDRGRFLLFDSESGKLTELGRIQRPIDSRELAQTELVHYPARDGLPIPAWLTVPEGAKGRKAPLVVLVSSDPWSRRLWNWQPEVQFLASRGYAVLQPETRGSAGHGATHFRKGLKQWGLGMQDDLADGARWAIARGLADPGRICIAGSSYGGYATLMGLAREPSLFKCGVAWSTITGIDVLHATSWRDPIAPFAMKGMPALQGVPDLYGMAALAGDPVADAAQWQATTPFAQAARITQPLLLFHGGADWRVPIAQAARLRDAIAAVNPGLEWVEYEADGHYWMQERNRLDFWARIEKFLRRNIGP